MYKVISSNNIPQCHHYVVNLDGTFTMIDEVECKDSCGCEGCRQDKTLCDYCKLHGDIYHKFSIYITNMIIQGWKCQGGLCCVQNNKTDQYELIQAMVYDI
jgi:hypothetical protein